MWARNVLDVCDYYSAGAALLSNDGYKGSLLEQNNLFFKSYVKAKEAKQKEALKREHRRQKDAEKEAQLVAKPAPSIE